MARKVPPEINRSEPGGLLLVGRDPGGSEDLLGKPFVGDAGDVLDRTLVLAGLRRKDINITNLVPWKPDRNDFSAHSVAQIEQGERELRALIDRLQPRLILAMGNEANYALVPNWPGKSIYSAKGVGDRRGYFWQTPDLPCPVMSTIHPALVLYQIMPNKMLLEIDMFRVRAFMKGQLPVDIPPDAKVARWPMDLLELDCQDIVAFDIETKWGGSDLLCIAFYGEAMERPVTVMARDFDWCVPFLEGVTPKVAHNGQFDTYFLEYKMGIKVGGFDHDTSILHWAQYPELAGKPETGGEIKGGMTRKSLAFLASQHLNVPWWKEYTDNPARMAKLCGDDVYVTRKLFDVMYPEAREMNVLRQYETSMKMIPMLTRIQSRGLTIDNQLRKERLKKTEARFNELSAQSSQAGLDYIRAAGADVFQWEKQCKCCGGGKNARSMCWRCAGFDRSPTKKMLMERLGLTHVGPTQTKDSLLASVLTDCQACNGVGKTYGYDFNPMSPKQMGELLFDELGVPKKTWGPRQERKADEVTLKRVLEWANE